MVKQEIATEACLTLIKAFGLLYQEFVMTPKQEDQLAGEITKRVCNLGKRLEEWHGKYDGRIPDRFKPDLDDIQGAFDAIKVWLRKFRDEAQKGKIARGIWRLKNAGKAIAGHDTSYQNLQQLAQNLEQRVQQLVQGVVLDLHNGVNEIVRNQQEVMAMIHGKMNEVAARGSQGLDAQQVRWIAEKMRLKPEEVQKEVSRSNAHLWGVLSAKLDDHHRENLQHQDMNRAQIIAGVQVVVQNELQNAMQRIGLEGNRRGSGASQGGVVPDSPMATANVEPRGECPVCSEMVYSDQERTKVVGSVPKYYHKKCRDQSESGEHKPGRYLGADAPAGPGGGGSGAKTIDYPDGNVYEGEVEDGDPSGEGVMRDGNGSKYEGKFELGMRNGKGKQTDVDGAIYEGDWVDGEREGKGKKTWPDGTVYEGEWKGDRRNGRGTMRFPNKDVYEGEWSDGDYHGKGRMTFSDGSTYKGDYRDGLRNGKGKEVLENGTVYEGDWKDGIMHGKGKKTYPKVKNSCIHGIWGVGASHAKEYDGDWKDGKAHGKGQMAYDNGNVYDGEMKEGLRNGKGRLTDADNGSVYEGEFKDDEFNGEGRMAYADGSVYVGLWKDGLRHGEGKLTGADGVVKDGEWMYGKIDDDEKDVYEGEYKDGKREGYGKMSWASGDTYEGEWKGGFYHGNGKETLADGCFFEGEYKFGLGNGICKSTYADGGFYEGGFKDDFKHGQGKSTFASDYPGFHEGEFRVGHFYRGKGKETKEDGSCYEGDFDNYTYNGIGKMTTTDGGTYEGGFKSGKMFGKGKATCVNGTVYKGEWRMGDVVTKYYQ